LQLAPYQGVYFFNFWDSPNTLNDISYSVFYQLQSTSTYQNGLIGDPSAANCLILEEYNSSGVAGLGQTGPTGPQDSLWQVQAGTTTNIYFDQGNVGIGKEPVAGTITVDVSQNTVQVFDGSINLDISGNTRINGVLDMCNNRIIDVSGIWFNDGTYIGAGFVVKPIRNFGTESGFVQLYYNPTTGEIAYT